MAEVEVGIFTSTLTHSSVKRQSRKCSMVTFLDPKPATNPENHSSVQHWSASAAESSSWWLCSHNLKANLAISHFPLFCWFSILPKAAVQDFRSGTLSNQSESGVCSSCWPKIIQVNYDSSVKHGTADLEDSRGTTLMDASVAQCCLLRYMLKKINSSICFMGFIIPWMLQKQWFIIRGRKADDVPLSYIN